MSLNLINVDQKKLVISIGLYSFFGLFFAFYFQYIENYPPCKLCLYQRIPYYISIIITLLYALNVFDKRILISLLGLNFLSSFMISGFHFGVEQKFWEYSSGCTSNIDSFENIDQLRNFLEKTEIVKCDEVILSFFGISMAAGNMLISLLLSIILIIIIKQEFSK